MKKVISLIMLATLGLSIVAGCSGAPDNQTAEGGPATTPNTPPDSAKANAGQAGMAAPGISEDGK